MEEDDYEFGDTHCPVCGRDADPHSGACYYCGAGLSSSRRRSSENLSSGTGCALPIFGSVALIIIFALLIIKLL